MKTLLLLMALVASHFPKQGSDEYVCLPCGQECDHKNYSGPGSCSACGMTLVKKSTIRFKNIELEEMCHRLEVNPKIVLLDVRTPDEFNGGAHNVPTYGHFKNAININVKELEGRIDEIAKYKDSEVIVYCSHSHRSPQASYLLGTHGFTNVKNLSGGVSTFSTHSVCLDKAFAFHTR